jgi:hypothetical protein
MADLSITAASVLMAQGATNFKQLVGTAGETITPGMTVYKKAADGLLYKANAKTAAANAAVVGVALNSASAGQPLVYCTQGDLTIGAAVAQGTVYYCSDDGAGAAGGINAAAPATGVFVTIIGVAKNTTDITVSVSSTGILHA